MGVGWGGLIPLQEVPPSGGAVSTPEFDIVMPEGDEFTGWLAGGMGDADIIGVKRTGG